MNRAEKIAKQNDAFRKTGIGGKTLMTSGVAGLNREIQMEIFRSIQSFSDFTEANDPHQEHDFGIMEISGRNIYWKIDYYDKNYEYGSEDPTDSSLTNRVITIMMADEY